MAPEVDVPTACDFCGGSLEGPVGCRQCCRDCGMPCAHEMDDEGFHMSENDDEEDEAPRRSAEQIAEDIKAEVLTDMRAGVVPETVTSYSALHDYVDANCYAGMADDGAYDAGRDEDAAILNAATDLVDAWLRSGAAKAEAEKAVVCPCCGKTVDLGSTCEGCGVMFDIACRECGRPGYHERTCSQIPEDGPYL
jgi:hypothetical protein